MYEQLKREFEYYLTHQQELVEKYNGKYIVIKNQTVIGEYNGLFEAVQETSRKHKPGTFLVQKCGPGLENYTVNIFFLRGEQCYQF